MVAVRCMAEESDPEPDLERCQCIYRPPQLQLAYPHLPARPTGLLPPLASQRMVAGCKALVQETPSLQLSAWLLHRVRERRLATPLLSPRRQPVERTVAGCKALVQEIPSLQLSAWPHPVDNRERGREH